jgi:hypothetical protein
MLKSIAEDAFLYACRQMTHTAEVLQIIQQDYVFRNVLQTLTIIPTILPGDVY